MFKEEYKRMKKGELIENINEKILEKGAFLPQTAEERKK